jgi:hypothetical protein
MRMIFGAIGGIKIGRGNQSTRRKPAQRHFVHHKIPHDQTRARTPDRRDGKPATNRLSYGAAILAPFNFLIFYTVGRTPCLDVAWARRKASIYTSTE